MAVVNLIINGHKVQAESGQSVLQAARSAGIDIPTLCNHPALKPESICRICVVEIERQRVLQPACTFPVVEGMVVQTDTEKVRAARRTVLQLLFSQRLHYCMYCTESGSSEDVECELQRLAYTYGLAHWDYAANSSKRWPVDASRSHFIMDHNRCIMCRRCVRACNEVVANHTLGIRGRGARTMIIADDDVPFGESSCVSCGTCLQVCPTGALIDRRSAFMGHGASMERTSTTCIECAVGCTVKAVTRTNVLHRIEGDWSAPNGGLLCCDGRFGVVETQPKRVSAPLVRDDDVLVETTWEDAISAAAQRMRSAKTVAALASARTTSETLLAFKRLFGDTIKTKQVGLAAGAVPPLDLGATGSVQRLPSADCVVIVGGDPWQEQKVLAYLVRRAVDRGAPLVVVNDRRTVLGEQAKLLVDYGDLAIAEGVVQSAERPYVLVAPGLDSSIYEKLRTWPSKTCFLPLVLGSNAVGAARLGLLAKPVRGDVLFVLAGDDSLRDVTLPESSFLIVQSAYHSDWTDKADIVLPAPIWSELDGHITNLEGRECALSASVKAGAHVRFAEQALSMLGAQMALAHPKARTVAG